MEVVFVLLMVVLFLFGLVSVAGALSTCDNSPQQITRRTKAEIEQLAAEGERAMDDLSEQYLNEVYDQVTGHTRRR